MHQQALIVATGPSLTREDVKLWSQNRRVYTVNDAYKWCDRIDVLYACDEQWWDVHHEATRHCNTNRWTTDLVTAQKYNLNHITGRHADDARKYFDASGHGIIYGGNSGFQALNLAYVLGIRNAVLLGFDMQDGPNGESHCFGDHPPSCDNPRPHKMWLDHWRKSAPEIAAAGMRVWNATRGGALDVFPRVGV